MKYFVWFFAALVLLYTINLVFAAQENAVPGAKEFPKSIKVGEKVPFSLKVSNLEEYRVSDIEPIITIMPKSASEYVHVEINPQISTLWDGFYDVAHGTIHVDKDIPVDRIFVSVSFMGKNPYGEQVPLSSVSTFSTSIKIEKESPNTESIFDYKIKHEAKTSKTTDSGIVYDIIDGTVDKITILSDGTLQVNVSMNKDGTLLLDIPKKTWFLADESCNPVGTVVFVNGQEFGIIDGVDDVKQYGYTERFASWGKTIEMKLPAKAKSIEFAVVDLLTNIPTSWQLGQKCLAMSKIDSPLKQFRSGTPSQQVSCKDGFELLLKTSNGHPICVKPSTKSKLLQIGWAEPLGNVVFQRPSQDIQELSEKSDRIIAGMVTDKEKVGNRTEVWIGIYEWLKKSPNHNSIILDIPQGSPESELDFQKGEEMLLFLRDIDPANGHFGIFYLDGKTKPTKYPLYIREDVSSFVKPEDKEPYYMHQQNENCENLVWENDSFLYCTYPEEEFRYYIPILETVDRVKQKMLQRVSEEYFAEHFDLRRAYDTAIVNGHTVPVGQDLEFNYKFGNQNFLYLVHVPGDDKEAYIAYFPPKEIQALVDESKIAELIQDCVGNEAYPLIWDKAMVSRDEKGFTPLISGGTPSIYDRYGKAVLHPTKQQFRIWPETGEIECTKGMQDFESNPIQPQKRELLIDSTEFLKIKNKK
ncbi:MAG TPA: hypothetical protein VNK07_00150 [Candidatus Binatia bacterium]|nr:hypothetical protein [Candidatus Binatia bacterium]